MSREALVVGINFYKRTTGFNSLNIPSEDAAEIARILAEEGDFSVRQLPEAVKDGEIRVGQKDGVTQKELIDALKQLFIPKGKNIPDTALFYFAGHGILSEEGLVPEGYLVTSDANPAEGKWGLSLKQLRELLENSEVRQQLIWLDCCHSGELLNFNQADPKDAGKARDRCFIAASRDFEPGYEQLQGNHGVLTGALLQGLNAERCPAGEWVTNLSLVNSINQVMDVEERRRRKIPQRPVYTIFGGAINLIQGRAQPEKALKNAVSEECPYQGLKAFEEEQKQFFFGRQQVINKIRHKLHQKPFVPVIGASGSGKSSVVRAGLIPLLKERESGWRVLKPIKPGTKPLTRLRGVFEEFFQSAKKEEQLDAFIENDPKGLVKLIEHLPGSERFLLVIDQFEEVFTVCPVEEDRRRFIELITQVAEIPDSRLAVVTTMRADFLEPCLQYESLTQLIQNQAIYMPPLMGGNLEKAIAKPAELQGYRLEDGLLGEILKDVKGAGSLPLLQFALTELWEKRDRQNHQLTLEQYKAMEGAIGSLNRHAEKVYTYKDFSEDSPTEERTKQEQEWIKRIFLKLVRTGEEEKDSRQRQPKGKLLAIAGDNPEDREALNEVIDELVQGRLLVTGEAEQKPDIADSVQDAKMIDLAHEALMEGWTQFAQWRQEDRQLKRLIDRVEDALREWEKQPKDENFMMGGLLAQVRQEWQNLEAYLEPTLKDFYQRSDSHEQDRIAELQKALTESRLQEKAARVLNLLPFRPLDGLVLAIQAMGENADKLPKQILSPVQNSLYRAMETGRVSIPFQGHEREVTSVAFSPDGQIIVSGSRDCTVRLWDIKGNPIGQPFQGHKDFVNSVAFSQDGRMIVSGSENRTVCLSDLNGNPIGQPFLGHGSYVRSVAFSPDGQMIVSGSWDKTLCLWDIKGNPIGQPFKGHEDYVTSVAFSPDGQKIVSGSCDRKVRLWDLQGNPIGKPLSGHDGAITSVAFSPDGQMIVSASDDKMRLWNIEGNPIGQPFLGHENYVYSVAFSPDGQMIVSGSADKTVRLWDIEGNPIGQPFLGHENYVYSVAFSPNGQMIVSGSADKTVRLWNIQGNSIRQLFQEDRDVINSVAFSPDGQMIVSGSADKIVRLWDIQGNPIGQPFQGHKREVTSVAFSSDGQIIVSGSRDKTIRLRDIQGNPIGQPFQGHEDYVTSVAFSPDSQTIVSGSEDKTLRLWDIQGSRIGQPFQGHEDYVTSVAFSPDGQMIVSGSADKTVRLWDIEGNPIGQPFKGHEDYVTSVAFSPDGQMIVSGSRDNTVRLFDIQGNPIGQPFRGHKGSVTSIAFSPNGQLIASGSHDKTVRLWDIQGNPIGQPFQGHESVVCSVAFSPDGKLIVSGSSDKTVRLWRGRWRAWLEVCCNRLRYHPVFKNPQTEVEKQACETCQKYVWSREES